MGKKSRKSSKSFNARDTTLNKIKVVHVIQTLVFGGAETSLYDICKLIDKNMFEITIIIFWDGDKLHKNFLELSGVRLINLGGKFRADISLYFKLLKILVKNRYDIVHVHMPTANIYSTLCKPFHRSIQILSQHSVRERSGILYQFNKFLTRFSDFVIANSEYTTNFLIKNNYSVKDKIKLIYLGINFKKLDQSQQTTSEIFQQYGIDKNAFILGYVASFKFEKGHKYLIDAVAPFLKENCKSILMLVGAGKLQSKIEDLVYKKDISKQVIFTGKKNNISDYLSVFDVFISSAIHESFGISIVEAMYKKVPVIAFRTDAIPELIENEKTGFLIDNMDSAEMYNRLCDVYKSDQLNNVSQQAYMSIFDRFSIKNTVKSLENFYLKIVKEKNI